MSDSRAMHGIDRSIAVLLIATAPAIAQRGTYSVSANLDQLVRQSNLIIRAHVVSAKVEDHPEFANLKTVVVTLRVDRVLRGNAALTYRFRQFIWDARDVADAAGYRKADEVLLFLNPVSPYGLTSPVGGEQGRFRILTDNKGKRYALNGRGNTGLFSNLPKVTAQGGPLSPQVQKLMAQPSGGAQLPLFEDAIIASVQRNQ